MIATPSSDSKISVVPEKSNAEVLDMAHMRSIMEEAEIRRWKYLGYCLRTPSSLSYTSLSWAPEGKRKAARRPRETWSPVIMKRLNQSNISGWLEAAAAAKDRDNWRRGGDVVAESQCSTWNTVT